MPRTKTNRKQSDLAAAQARCRELERELAVARAEQAASHQDRTRSEARYQALAEAAHDMIFIVSRDGVVEYVNAFGAKQFGRRPTDMIGQRHASLFPAETGNRQQAALLQVITTGEARYIENRTHFPFNDLWLGTWLVPLRDENGTPNAVLGISRDITERKNAENALADERRLFIGGPVVVVKWRNADNWPVEYASPNITDLVGYPSAEFTSGRVSYVDIIHPADRLQILAEVERCSKAGVRCYEQEYRLRTAAGTYKWVYDFTTVVRAQDGTITHYNGYILDISDRRQTEQNLRESEAKYRAIIEATSTGYVVLDSDGCVLDANAEYVRLTGRPDLTSIRGRPVTDWTAPHDLDRNAAEVRKCATMGQIHNLEVDYVAPDGRLTPVEINASVVRGDDCQRIISMVRDITKRRRTEQAWRESEAKFRSMMEAMDDLVYICSSDYHVEYMNPAMVRRTGRQASGEKCYAALHDRDSICPWCVNDIVQQGRTHKWQMTSPKDERTYHVSNVPLFHPDGRISKMAVIRDITELKRAEQATRQSLSRFEAIISNTPMVAVQGFDRGGTIRHWNPASEALYGYRAQEAMGKPLAELLQLSPAEARNFLAKLEAIWQTGKPHPPQEWTVRTRGGEVRHVYSAMFPVELGDAVEEVFCMDVDVTARKQAEEERRRLESQFQHTQKLESLGVLAGGIAHDFNNILMAVLGHIDLALAELSPVSPIRDSLREVEKAACRAAELCRQMLAYSGKGTFVLTAVSINELVEEMAHMLEVSISKKVTVRYSFDTGNPVVEADPSQLQQVVMNLVINASEAIGDRPGTISLATSTQACDAGYLANAWTDDKLTPGRYVCVEVTDTGCGMDQETQSRIFDPFFTTKFTGRGLGLAAVLGIVRAHHGTLKVYSEKGRGTTFKVYLPAVAKTANGSAPSSTVEEKLWRGHGTILLVDDEEAIRELGRKMLEYLGFQALVAADGYEAVDLYREHGGTITCVILDLTMPNMDGDETLRELRRLDPAVRVIMASGYGEQDVRAHLTAGGLAGFIQKPYQVRTLAGKLKELLG